MVEEQKNTPDMAASSESEHAPPRKKANVRFAFACAILASMTSILLGYDIGVMSGASLFIKEDLKITDVEVEILLGILNLYSLVGSFAAGRTSDWIGRRLTIILAAVIFFVGAIMMGLSVNYPMLMTGRFVAGIGVGYALMIAPVYTAEVSPASSRGFLTSFPEVFINLGILLGYVSNYAFSRLRLQLGWRLMLGVGAAPSVALALMVLAMPESPRWLVMKGRLADAKAVLAETSDTAEEAATRLAEIKEAAAIPADLDGDVVAVPKRAGGERRVWKELILSPTPAVRRVLLSALGIHFFQQSSGIDAVVLYSPRVFQSAGITDKNKLLGTTCAVGVTKTLFILVATFTLDRFGRRPLLLASAGGMVATLVTLGLGLTVIGEGATGGGWAIAVSIASILAFVAFFSIGLGPITWVYSSEIFPLHLRALGCALGVGLNRVTSGVISMTFLSLSKAITIGGSFFLYAGIASLAWLFFFTYLPETRGQTLEQMGELFGIHNMAGDDDSATRPPSPEEEKITNYVEMAAPSSSSSTATSSHAK
uniref:Major facilitator superfamily (MFS) profile domain-containing protein n=1 Tax=Oryza meridionalis TaxID=40149 RepID=A0A0E0CDE1_9ORYZ